MIRIILSAVIAIGFHIALMVFISSMIKKNIEILPPQIKSVMVTLSYRQPVIEKEIHSTKQLEKIITKPKPEPKPKKAISFTPKKKTSPVLKKKNPAPPPKQDKPVIYKQKEVIKRPLTPVKTAPVKAEMAETRQIKAEKKENIKQVHIEFAKPLYKKNSLPAYPVIARKRG